MRTEKSSETAGKSLEEIILNDLRGHNYSDCIYKVDNDDDDEELFVRFKYKKLVTPDN